MKDFKKQCRIGAGTYVVWVTIEYIDRRLSISGVETPKTNGDCAGSCGQIQDNLNPLEFSVFSPGWDAVKVAKLKKIWSDWHLNDMCAGSPDQNLLLDTMKEFDKPSNMDHYDWACKVLKLAGIYEDPNYMHNGKPYRYGSLWLRKQVPEEVLQWLYDLPEADRPHPWGLSG